MTPEQLSEALRLISHADDSQLDKLHTALRARDRALHVQRSAQAMATIHVGDTVSLHNISPKYLVGVRAKVTEHHGAKFTVEVLEADSFRLGKYGRVLRVPAGSLRVIEAA